MPLNFREGMRRLGILVGVLGAIAGAIGGYLLAIDAHASAAKGLLGEPVLVDYAVAASLPVGRLPGARNAAHLFRGASAILARPAEYGIVTTG